MSEEEEGHRDEVENVEEDEVAQLKRKAAELEQELHSSPSYTWYQPWLAKPAKPVEQHQVGDLVLGRRSKM